MKQEKLLILVKTYPTLSTKYGETVCTAGIREDGSWIRLYPVPFRRLDQEEQYKKFDWIECNVIRKRDDRRPESFSPVNEAELIPISHMGRSQEWADRRDIVLGKAKVYHLLEDLIAGAKQNKMSLAVFKPTRIIDFICENEESRDWDPKKLAAMRAHVNQFSLLDDNEWRKTFRVIPKLPYKFSYRFLDQSGQRSKMQILDWEIGALFWKCVKSDPHRNEERAIEKVRSRYFDEFKKKDVHFFMGTTMQFHSIAPNPWLITGVFPIPFQTQLRLL